MGIRCRIFVDNETKASTEKEFSIVPRVGEIIQMRHGGDFVQGLSFKVVEVLHFAMAEPAPVHLKVTYREG